MMSALQGPLTQGLGLACPNGRCVNEGCLGFPKPSCHENASLGVVLREVAGLKLKVPV